jgi:acetyl esterase/lipase
LSPAKKLTAILVTMKNYLNRNYGWVACLLFLTACQKEAQETGGNLPAKTMMNVAYGSDPLQKLDIYLPSGRSIDTTKVIILIHEGAWSDGDKSGFDTLIPHFQQRLPSYAIFNLNYRLADGASNFFPTQENDVKSAIGFIYSKRSEYGISDKFVYLGASAGGHLALLEGYKYTTPVKPKAIVSFFGPTDLTSLYNSNPFAGLVLSEVVGATPVSNPALYAQSSPITFVSAASPPTLLLQGGADPIVPPFQADSLLVHLTTANVPHQYIFYPAESHGWFGATLDDSFDKIAVFLHQYVN